MNSEPAAVLLSCHDAGHGTVALLDQLIKCGVEPYFRAHLVQLFIERLESGSAVLIFVVAFVFIGIIFMGKLGSLLLEIKLHPIAVQPLYRVRRLLHDGSGQRTVGQIVIKNKETVYCHIYIHIQFFFLLPSGIDGEKSAGQLGVASHASQFLHHHHLRAGLRRSKSRTGAGTACSHYHDIHGHFLRLALGFLHGPVLPRSHVDARLGESRLRRCQDRLRSDGGSGYRVNRQTLAVQDGLGHLRSRFASQIRGLPVGSHIHRRHLAALFHGHSHGHVSAEAFLCSLVSARLCVSCLSGRGFRLAGLRRP